MSKVSQKVVGSKHAEYGPEDLLKEARRTAFVLEEVKEFVPPGDRIVTTSLLVPELSELVIGSNEVKKALEK